MATTESAGSGGGIGDLIGDAGGAIGDGIGNLVGGAGDVINGVSGVVSYWSDPWGNTFKALQEAADGMSKDILPALTSATLPDLNAEWFLNAYRLSFATAIFIAVALLIPQAIRTARGVQAGRELVESAGLYFGLFLLGAMFGPGLGIILISFFHSLSNVFVQFGVTGSVESTIGAFQTMIKDADPAGVTGGVPIAVFLMLCMIVGLFLVVLILLVQLVTLYFAGVLFPLGLVWIIDPTKRTFGTRIGALWIGILAAHPLLLLLLGVAYSMMAAQVGAFGDNFGLKSMVGLLVAIIAMFLAAMSPLLLMKFAPIIPAANGGSQGPSLSAPTIGAKNMTDAGKRNAGGSRTSTNGTGTDGSSSSVGNASAEPGGENVSLSEISSSQASSPAMAMAKPGGAVSGGAAVAEGGAAGGAGAAEGLAAAGAAESSTGVGAAIGIPTIAAAVGVAAASKGASLAQKGGEHSVAAMDDPDSGKA